MDIHRSRTSNHTCMKGATPNGNAALRDEEPSKYLNGEGAFMEKDTCAHVLRCIFQKGGANTDQSPTQLLSGYSFSKNDVLPLTAMTCRGQGLSAQQSPVKPADRTDRRLNTIYNHIQISFIPEAHTGGSTGISQRGGHDTFLPTPMQKDLEYVTCYSG